MISCTGYKVIGESEGSVIGVVSLFIDNYTTNFNTQIENYKSIVGLPAEMVSNPTYALGSSLYDVATGDLYLNNGSGNKTGWVKQ